MKGIFLGATLVSGLAWAWWGAGSCRIGGRMGFPGFLLILAAMLLMEGRSLASSIPLMGDEDHHVILARDIAGLLASHPVFLAIPILIGLAGLAIHAIHPKRAATAIPVAMLLGMAAALSGYHTHLDEYFVLRYPIFLKYLTAAPVYLFSLLPESPPPEIPYRILPLLASAATVWYAFRRLRPCPPWVRLLAALFLATLPLVRYYATIFYLEMPAVFCMTVVLFHANTLIRSPLAILVRSPGWYALLMLGFIKETTLPFLAAFLLSRMFFRGRAAFVQGRLLQEFQVAFCACLPLAAYLFYRTLLGDARPYSLHWDNLANPLLLGRYARSLSDSFGFLLPLAAAGIAITAARGKRPALVFNLLALAFVSAFHYLDYPQYLGYSRFNLFLLPSLIYLGWCALKAAAYRSLPAAAAALLFGVAVNIGLSPIHPDGSKKSRWGVYGEDTGEHYYPYREAFRWIEAHHPGIQVRMTGHDYRYYTKLYQDGGLEVEQVLVVNLPDPAASLHAALASAARAGAPLVLYHLPFPIPDLPDTHGYAVSKVFQNRAHALMLFHKDPLP